MKFQFRDEMGRARAAAAIAHYPLDGSTLLLEVREVSEKRRDSQNRLLWKWNSEFQAFMADHYGQLASAEDWHDILCRRLRPVTGKTVNLPDGAAYTTERWRSSKAGVREMSEYLNDLDAYCTTIGLLLSHPDDLYREAMVRRAA